VGEVFYELIFAWLRDRGIEVFPGEENLVPLLIPLLSIHKGETKDEEKHNQTQT
jgi:hypothetical protein